MRYFYVKVTFVTEQGRSDMDLGFKVQSNKNLNKKEIKDCIEQKHNLKISSLFLDNIYEFNNEKESVDFWG